MGINLQKGQKIDLTKSSGAELTKIMVGLGWDPVEKPKGGLFSSKSGASIDCDASIILCGSNGKIVPGGAKNCVIYFGNKVNSNGSIVHQGDNLTGQGDGDDEQVMVKLSEVPSEVDKLVFVVNIYNGAAKKQHFGLIKNAYIRIIDTDTNTEICKFNLSENYDNMTGLVVGEVYRKNGVWKFNAIGQGVVEASRLESLIGMYS